MADAGRGRGAGRGGGTAAPPGGAVRATGTLQRKPLETGDRLSTYGLDLDSLRFDLDGPGGKGGRASRAEEPTSVADMWSKKGKNASTQVETIDGAKMFGDYDIKVASAAKAGTELGFEFKAILDQDFANFSADDFDVEINASSIALSGVSNCEQCKKSIIHSQDGVTAFGKAYHRNHIKCSATGKDFTGGGDAYEGDDGQVYCQAEYEKRFLKTCSTCKLAIKEKKPLIAGGKPYHKACFKCSVCNDVLVGRWFEDEGKVLCENDFHRKRGTVCPACTKPVDGEPKKVGKYSFHKACYNCAYCRREPSNFFKQIPRKKGVIYCSTCAHRIFPEDAAQDPK